MPSLLSRQDIEHILTRYFINGDRSLDIVQTEVPEMEVDLNIVDHVLSASSVHDQDYLVFKHFTDKRTTILDIGANFGYSASTMWHLGVEAGIASFEPIVGFAPILTEIQKRKNPQGSWSRLLRPWRYEVYPMGISDKEGTATFCTSVVNGRMQSALTTADTSPDIPTYVNNTFHYVENYIGELNTFKLYEFTAPITTIDKWASSGTSKLNMRKIVAMKIDTEGFEGRVLVGAAKLLESQKPLIMAEGGHTNELAIRTALDRGYSFAEREGDQLRPSTERTEQVNGFFIHPERVPYYRKIGLMA